LFIVLALAGDSTITKDFLSELNFAILVFSPQSTQRPQKKFEYQNLILERVSSIEHHYSLIGDFFKKI